ncbi:MAG: hypothetical protein IPM63_12885 [Acidobacteriota bacterium]|nr:MAG: hypothetical protein IPM63_12885 [Acidobacteriota bacterium]
MSDTNTGYRNPKRVRLTVGLVYFSTYFKNDDRGVVAKAREVLDDHNIELDVFPTDIKKTASNTIQTDFVPKDTPEDYAKVYKMAKDKLKQMGCTFVIPLPVVFGTYQCSGYGIAPRAPNQLTRLVMIYPEGNSDGLDLLHEIGHASELGHDLRTDDPPRNFMHTTNPRAVMYEYQVKAIAKAPFAVG